MAEDYYSVLGIPKTASASEVRRAYLKLARNNHPDRFTDPAERAEADRRFQLITEAFNTLRDEKLRQDYDRTLDRKTRTPKEEARLYFKNAELREQSKDYDGALKLYYEAMRIQPEELDYVLAAGRLLGMDKSKQRRAAELYTQAMEKHPNAPEPHLELGAVYARSGMWLRAKRVYEKALEKMPNHPELKKRLAEAASKAGKK